MPIGLALGAAHLFMGLILGITIIFIPFSYHHFALANLCVQSPYCKRRSNGTAEGPEAEQDQAILTNNGTEGTEEQQRAMAGTSGAQRSASQTPTPSA